jgi:sphingomyelin phosphodiesterase
MPSFGLGAMVVRMCLQFRLLTLQVAQCSDIPPHNVWNQSRTDQLTQLNNTVALLLRYFPNVKVYPALGNHEAAPVNIFPPPGMAPASLDIGWLMNALAQQWETWLPAVDVDRTIRYAGFYSVSAGNGLRIISLNMNYCAKNDFWLVVNSVDPADELAWLVQELTAAEQNGELVYLLGVRR